MTKDASDDYWDKFDKRYGSNVRAKMGYNQTSKVGTETASPLMSTAIESRNSSTHTSQRTPLNRSK